jgi:hypothetical protein
VLSSTARHCTVAYCPHCGHVVMSIRGPLLSHVTEGSAGGSHVIPTAPGRILEDVALLLLVESGRRPLTTEE